MQERNIQIKRVNEMEQRDRTIETHMSRCTWVGKNIQPENIIRDSLKISAAIVRYATEAN
jgi:hypothetical protein